MVHQFHIPVLGLAFSVDTPLKVAKYGISSTVSIVDDDLLERMRAYHEKQNGITHVPIAKTEDDYRAKRVTAYLNLLNDLVEQQFANLQSQDFGQQNELSRYFELLPDSSQLKIGYDLMEEYPDGESKKIFGNILKKNMEPGAVDVNIMAKVDRMMVNAEGELVADHHSEALAALRGFAQSKLRCAVVLSAGMNPRLYNYLESFDDFFPDPQGQLKKKIILKVSDYRSANIQAKYLAKKGLWVSEFRIESGLNCGGHAFATEGHLLGPVLDEFKHNRSQFETEIASIYQNALQAKGYQQRSLPNQKISVQGGIGTSEENGFLLSHYNLSTTGWGSPFLLVPEVTNVDDDTLQRLADATPADFYVSNASPLGVPFNNFKGSSMEALRLKRIAAGKPGSPCTKKYLCSNTEFTAAPICTASSEYQRKKIAQLATLGLSATEYQQQLDEITAKACLCDGLATSAYIKTQSLKPKEQKAVAICPGPNLAYFNRIFSLEQLIGHIYGKFNLLQGVKRPNLFIKELNLYIEYLEKQCKVQLAEMHDKKRKQLLNFKEELKKGIAYYHKLGQEFANGNMFNTADFIDELLSSEHKLQNIAI